MYNQSFLDQRQVDILTYLNGHKNFYPILTLLILSTNLNFEQKEFLIYPNGLVNSNRFNAKDGFVFFGNDKKYSDFIFPNENFKNKYKNVSNNNNSKNNSKNVNNFESPFFLIYFNIMDEFYYIKNTNRGLGALMKISSFEIKTNVLVNIGSTYLVISFDFTNLKLTIKIFNNDVYQNKKTKENFEKKTFHFKNKENSIVNIGRSEQSDLFINDFKLSRNHCHIIYYFELKKLLLVDGDYNNSSLCSVNGTWVYVSHSQKIEHNSEFKVNNTRFKILCSNFEAIGTENENINDDL